MPVATPSISASNVAQQATTDDPQGLIVFPRSGSLGGFFGTTPIVQPAGNAQAVLLRGQQAGTVTTYVTTQSPSIVNANTSSEKAMTVQTGTGAAMLLATTDLCYINKPTSQAGLGVGNIRVSASNTAQVTMMNWTNAGITPTTSQGYFITALRGMATISATLSPAAVGANLTTEQQFTITPTAASPQGLPVGTLVQVVKPTSQAGIDIVGCRVVSNNVIGITFANVTASPVTPTASEVYTIFALSGLDAINNEVLYGFNVGTVGAIGAGVVVSGGSTALTGVLATDSVVGIFKPTPQAAATNVAVPIFGIPTADTLTMYFLGIGAGATPTASEVYTIAIKRINPVAPLLLYNQSLTPVSVAANTTAEQTFTVTGLIANTPVWVNKPSWTSGLGIAGVRVSGTNTLAINFTNSTTAAIVPPVETYVIGNFQMPAPAAGNCVWQTASPWADRLSTLAAGTRSALTTTGFMAGT